MIKWIKQLLERRDQQKAIQFIQRHIRSNWFVNKRKYFDDDPEDQYSNFELQLEVGRLKIVFDRYMRDDVIFVLVKHQTFDELVMSFTDDSHQFRMKSSGPTNIVMGISYKDLIELAHE